ncbi:aldo/keto reductase [Mesorhizobium xinjiangense]|uniref:aldo/keto reductase n=1 Tax=Mesorhizobium xinjiangense TaxID=2678685 RepID=UPI0012EEDE56|nr:aldo/keto reductase [Mesorhizobium xinjiangense]
MISSRKLRWGILGPGNIAKAFAGGLAHSETGELVALGARHPDKPNYAQDFPGARVLDGYQALIDDPEVEAVYIAVPHPLHAEWAIKAARGGKHVLCEKPMGLSAYEADAAFCEARKAGTFMGEAFMYRVHPQTTKLIELVADGAIGTVRMIKSSFGFAMPSVMPEHRLYANHLAGGGILDVGCYPVSIARLLAGAVEGKPFLDPVKVVGTAHLGETGIDEWASAILHFGNDIIAEASCSISLKQDNMLRIYGTEGRIEVADFWFASGHEGGVGEIDIIRPDRAKETVAVEESRWLYSFEVDAVAETVSAGSQEFAAPGMSWDDTLGNMRTLDKWRAAAGLTYEVEKSAQRRTTLAGEKLAQRSETIGRRKLPGIGKPLSEVALGFEDFPDFASAAILLDAFFEAGGNVFDTAFVYGGGRTEAILGDWLASRGVREEAVVIGKGAHSPLTYPDVIARQLDQSLERLKTDHVDVYFMHRDNPDVPVDEFVDAIDAEVKAGRIRGLFGGSNWSRERMAEAIDYAEKNGRTAPGVLSNNFSLAEMIDPVWAGCVSASDADWKAWLGERQIPNFAWSSQGRGFFTERAGRNKRDNEELVRCWYSDGNFARRDRAEEMAKERGVKPIHIALAYALAQPFPVVPLIGPRRLVELDDSLTALALKLSPEDVRWLETGER